MVMASFDPAHVKRYFPALQTVAQRLIGRWKTAAREHLAFTMAPVGLRMKLKVRG